MVSSDAHVFRSVIYDWAAETSAYIKALDANHMVTMGDEGFGPLAGGDGSYPYQTDAGGYVWRSNLDIPTLDFGTLHLYPGSCTFPYLWHSSFWCAYMTNSYEGGEPYDWGNLWITTHGAGCVNASKPCLLEECKL